MHRLRYWFPAICVALLISAFSTHYFSAAQTGQFIIPILHWIFPSAGLRPLRVMDMVVRTLAHVTEFGVFSIAVFHGIRAERHGWKLSWAGGTLIVALVFAGLDEWHQLYVPLREARVRDVAMDVSGALLAQLLVWTYSRFHKPSRDPATSRSA